MFVDFGRLRVLKGKQNTSVRHTSIWLSLMASSSGASNPNCWSRRYIWNTN